MDQRIDIYKCQRCGNLVEILNKEEQKAPVCCDHPMVNLLDTKGNHELFSSVSLDEIQKGMAADINSIPSAISGQEDDGSMGFTTNGMLTIHKLGADGTIEVEILMNT